VDLRLRR